MSNKKHLTAVAVIIGVFVIVALILWPKERVDVDSGQRLVMGTFARIIAVAADSETAKKTIEAAFEQLNKVEELMSYHNPNSEISRINREAHTGAVKVSKDTFEVLQKSVEFSKLTEGAFDITVGPLVELWRLAGEANSVPTNAELAEARSKVGYEKLVLDANEMSVWFAVEGMRLDLGGIAKGYAIDKAIEVLQKSGVVGGMVDVGGDIRCFGVPPRGKKYWLIGLQDPNEAKQQIGYGRSLLVLKLTDAAVATSGGYRRFTLIEGKKYSHIIDRRTAAAVEGLSSVTIIADNATDADALATAVSVMGAEKALALIEKLPDAEAILITSPPKPVPSEVEGYQLIKTTGAEKYIN